MFHSTFSSMQSVPCIELSQQAHLKKSFVHLVSNAKSNVNLVHLSCDQAMQAFVFKYTRPWNHKRHSTGLTPWTFSNIHCQRQLDPIRDVIRGIFHRHCVTILNLVAFF